MSMASRIKSPMDVLQSMLNAVLIETGRIFPLSGKEGGRNLANANTKIKLTIPSIMEHFQEALDDVECDILRAKAVLLRDLEELRAKRYALENPVPIVEEVEPIPEPGPELAENGEPEVEEDTAGFAKIKEERIQSTSPQKQDQAQSLEDPTKEDIAKATADSKEEQGPTPPPSNEKESKPIGLGINTDGAADSSAADTADVQNSAVDSLFDIPENENVGDSDLNFENMDFSMHDSNQDPSGAETQEFDLSTFGANTQDFNMADAQPNSNTASNTNNENKEIDDLFAMDTAGDNMDLDLDMGMAGAEQSLFDDMYFDDMGGGGGGGEEMEHGDFDAIFLGMDD